MPTTRTATTHWEGTLFEGAGKVTLESSGLGTYDVSWPARTEEPHGKTSPEELIAAAHSSCFAMALSNEIGKAGGTPTALEVTAEVTLGQKDGASAITGITLTVRGEVEGLDADAFQTAAQAAKVGCPWANPARRIFPSGRTVTALATSTPGVPSVKGMTASPSPSKVGSSLPSAVSRTTPKSADCSPVGPGAVATAPASRILPSGWTATEVTSRRPAAAASRRCAMATG